ncbi:MAG TPA: hypothetical protein VKD22_08215 [Ramlibacter sp.]|nr:hypothetical protein [Ramlibacter sp.]
MTMILRTAALAMLTAAGAAANAQPAPPDGPVLSDVPVEQLKVMYLRCDRLARLEVLSPAGAARCSAVSRQLLARGFDGDFSRLLAWWRIARSVSVCNDPNATPAPERCDSS